MIEQAKHLLVAHRKAGVLMDSNLLFVFVLGAVDRAQISVAKKTRQFAESDFDLLLSIMDRVERLIVTAYVAAEVSNLATSLGHVRSKFLELFRALLTNMAVERHIPLRCVVELDAFEEFGATDAAILRVRTRRPLVITADWALAMKLESAEHPVINFNHIRGVAMGI